MCANKLEIETPHPTGYAQNPNVDHAAATKMPLTVLSFSFFAHR